MLDIVTTMNLLHSFCMSKRFTKNLNLYGPFLWIGFNCLKATEPLRGRSLQICLFYNFISPLTAYSKKVRHKMTNFEKIKILSDVLFLVYLCLCSIKLTYLKNIELNLLSFPLYTHKKIHHYNKIFKIWVLILSKIYLTYIAMNINRNLSFVTSWNQ